MAGRSDNLVDMPVVVTSDLITSVPTGDSALAHVTRSYDVNLLTGTTTAQAIVTPSTSKVWLIYDFFLMNTTGTVEANFTFLSDATVVGRLSFAANGDRQPTKTGLPIMTGLVGGDALNVQKPSAAALVGYITIGYRNA